MSLRVNFSSFKVKLQWLLDSADLINRPEHANRLPIRLLTVNTEFSRLEEAYQHIIELADPSVTAENEVLTTARLEYKRALEAFDKLMIVKLEQSPQSSESSENRSDHGRTDSDVLLSRLPTLRLPSFSGEMDQWVGFNNLFDSLVDSRSDLSPAQKLAYLMSCLSGEARGLVQHIKISDDGYKTARELLMKRYQDTRRLADVHVDQILKLSPISARLNGLRTQFLNPLIMAVNSLERLGFPVSDWSFLLLHICLNKLPTSIKTRFEQKCGSETDIIPTFSELIDFLETECRLIECSKSDVANYYPEFSSGHTAPKPPRRQVQYAAVAVTHTCSYCGDSSHSNLVACREYKSLSPYARKDFVDRNNLCFYCLGNHSYRDCRRIPQCGCGSTKHHPSLCFNRSGTYHHHEINYNTRNPTPPKFSGDVRRHNIPKRGKVTHSSPRSPSPNNRGQNEKYRSNAAQKERCDNNRFRFDDERRNDRCDEYESPRLNYSRDRQ